MECGGLTPFWILRAGSARVVMQTMQAIQTIQTNRKLRRAAALHKRGSILALRPLVVSIFPRLACSASLASLARVITGSQAAFAALDQNGQED